ncbi:MAG: Non-reducing end beta-L-arabinofuranosidase [Lentisphaerae bacterium ADurb.Bin242]|nr:MAG: Non-reducing end beta-L-arabinofuranosidase [Lentisphaerae bacterium ADurb.Bin242]
MTAYRDTFQFLPSGAVTLKGPLGTALEKSIENRLKKVNYANLVRPFRLRDENDNGWRCEFWGKVVRSAIRSWRCTRDPELLRIIRETVDDLCSTQTPDGCISTYPEALHTTHWDIWGRKYAMLGLARYYHEIEPSEKIREVLRRCLDHLIGEVGPGARRIVDCGMHGGLAASSILGAVIQAARITGEKRFLDYARWIVEQGGSADGNIFTAAGNGTPPARLGNGKAYEMTSCFEGLLEYYRETGNPAFLEEAAAYYRGVRDREIFITGGGGLKDRVGEFWDEGTLRQTHADAGGFGETCITVTWLRFCSLILRITGDSSAVDEMERSFYNALLGAALPDASCWAHVNPTPLAGASCRKPADDQILHCFQKPFDGHDCCLAQGPEGLATAPCTAILRDERGPVVNLYEACEAAVPLTPDSYVKLSITGNYPDDPEVSITLAMDSEKTFALRLRIPAWSRNTAVRVNGKPIQARPGTYLTLERTWKNGDRIDIAFDFSLRVLPAPDGCGRVALMRGPILLAQDSRLGEVDRAIRPGDSVIVETTSVPDIRRIYRLADGSLLCDYASAGNRFSEDNTLCVWMKTIPR